MELYSYFILIYTFLTNSTDGCHSEHHKSDEMRQSLSLSQTAPVTKAFRFMLFSLIFHLGDSMLRS